MATLRCTSCGYAIPQEAFKGRESAPCPLCGRVSQAWVLPALAVGAGDSLAASRPPSLPDDPPGPGDNVCFYNPERRATTSCSHCGVFISDAWAAQWGGETVCFKCLDNLRLKRQDSRFQSRRVLWDNIALMTALSPFLLCIPLLLLGPVGVPFIVLCAMASLITAPTGLGLSIFAWGKPRSLVPRGRGRVVWAALLSLIQCAIWVALFIGVVSKNFG
ncbi:hypothetical protein [Verrucomicrobium sp. BvORR106]|uniref:hypothetical protein n=1 Tax=Verrucomicrobium sp. BvORR106 TaxID=1403819 RepID=UPI000570BBC0|nr:hypothetical protein [Verrucomicrobium sp. BvORR106]